MDEPQLDPGSILSKPKARGNDDVEGMQADPLRMNIAILKVAIELRNRHPKAGPVHQEGRLRSSRRLPPGRTLC
jgi:hypothetical protein